LGSTWLTKTPPFAVRQLTGFNKTRAHHGIERRNQLCVFQLLAQ